MTNITTEINHWVIIIYEGKIFPGIVMRVNEDGAIVSAWNVKRMKKTVFVGQQVIMPGVYKKKNQK